MFLQKSNKKKYRKWQKKKKKKKKKNLDKYYLFVKTNAVLIWFNKWEREKKKKKTSKCHLLKILYRALRAKTFNCQKKMIIMIVVWNIRLHKI